MKEMDTRIPDATTAWQLWHLDLFDRDAPRALQSSGVDIRDGLFQLWRYTLGEGILDNGNASFSSFHLTWGSSPRARVDVAVNPLDNQALLKLRRWAGFGHKDPDKKDGQVDQVNDAILWRLAHLHDELLQASSRWESAGIDWAAESRELLARVDLIANPEEL